MQIIFEDLRYIYKYRYIENNVWHVKLQIEILIVKILCTIEIYYGVTVFAFERKYFLIIIIDTIQMKLSLMQWFYNWLKNFSL